MRRIRVVSVATAVATYCLIVLGSTVRVTNSGMGCPGWPLCSGKYGPIHRFGPLMEQSHRYLATIVTILIFATALLVWREGREARFLRWPAGLSVAAIVVQVVLGAVTVIAKNAGWTVAAHLLVAMVFLAVVTVTAVGSFLGSKQSWMRPHRVGGRAWGAVGGLFSIIVSGTLVVDGGAESVCRSWIVCSGSRASQGLITLQLVHRGVVIVGATLVLTYLVSILRLGSLRPSQHVFAVLGLCLLGLQVIVGIFNSALGAPAGVADVHLAVATALWVVVIALADMTASSSVTRSHDDHASTQVVEADHR
jgi:heme A synthase